MQFVDLCLIIPNQLIDFRISGHLIVLIVEFNQVALRLLQFIQIHLLLVAARGRTVVAGTPTTIQVLVGIRASHGLVRRLLLLMVILILRYDCKLRVFVGMDGHAGRSLVLRHLPDHLNRILYLVGLQGDLRKPTLRVT